MISSHYGGSDGYRLDLVDNGDLVVVRCKQRGIPPDRTPLDRRSLEVFDRLRPVAAFPASGVGVYAAPEGAAEELSDALASDPALQFAGRGLADPAGEPVVYTENAFVKFADTARAKDCREALRTHGFTVRRKVPYLRNGYFVRAEDGIGRSIFPLAEQMLERDDVVLCHPELVRRWSHRRKAFHPQWHLRVTSVGGARIQAHANVERAWPLSTGDGITIAVIDNGFDVDHEEFSAEGKIVAPRSFGKVSSDDPRPGQGDDHGTAVAGVACAAGRFGAAGVAPDARLMPLRSTAGLGSQDEADAFAWAADHGADIISCSWGPTDGRWWGSRRPAAHPGRAAARQHPAGDRLRGAHRPRRPGVRGRVGRGQRQRQRQRERRQRRLRRQPGRDRRHRLQRQRYPLRLQRLRQGDRRRLPQQRLPHRDGPATAHPGYLDHGPLRASGVQPGQHDARRRLRQLHQRLGGTSSACPGVAGTVALVLSVAPALRPQEVREILQQSADRIADEAGEYDADGHSDHYGHGRVNAAAAVRLAQRRQGRQA